MRAAVPGTTFAIETLDGLGRASRRSRAAPRRRTAARRPAEEHLRDDVVKVLARHQDLEPEDFWAGRGGRRRTLVTTTWSLDVALVEISAAGVTKATTLARSPREMGVGAGGRVAFGDMPNDLPMLEWAGTSYAMANAHPPCARWPTTSRPATTTTAWPRCWPTSSTCAL